MLSFNDLFFEKRIDDNVRIWLYRYFYHDFKYSELVNEIGEFEIKDKKIRLKKMNEEAEKKILRFFRKYKATLKNSLTGSNAIYVDEEMDLPLVGLNFLGILDKGSEMIEIKPITGCNADCSFCSVSEGISSKKENDFVIDSEYLLIQLAELLEYKNNHNMSIWINPHGEPLLYDKIVELCGNMLANQYVKDINIVTNGILLTKELIDSFEKISTKYKKKMNISISISALEDKLSKKIMGEAYNANLIIKNLEYAITRLPITITPVFCHGLNDDEIKKIINLAKLLSLKAKYPIKMGIQNFCRNKHGRNPVKELPWDAFFKLLKDWENETSFKTTSELGKIEETKQLPLICKNDELISVRILCDGRHGHDKVGIYETKDGSRAVALLGCNVSRGHVKARVIENKYNMVLAKC